MRLVGIVVFAKTAGTSVGKYGSKAVIYWQAGGDEGQIEGHGITGGW